MGHAKHIGRVGALAVGLGVGCAIAGGGGIAWADETSTTPKTSNEAGGDGTASHHSRSASAGAARTATGTVSPALRRPRAVGSHRGGGPKAAGANAATAEVAVDDRVVRLHDPIPATTADAGDTGPGTGRSPVVRALRVPDAAAVAEAAPAPRRGAVAPAVFAVLAQLVRRESGQSIPGALPAAALQQAAAVAAPTPSSIEDDLLDALAWVVNRVIRPYFDNRTPVTTPQQIVLESSSGSITRAFDAFDPDGNRLVFTVNTGDGPGAPRHGTVTIDQANGTFTYTPDGTFTDSDTFSYGVSDDTGLHLHGLGFLTEAFAGHQASGTVTVFASTASTATIGGDFSVLTYNIADLPFPLSSAAFPRSLNTLEIGNRINHYDVVNVQEDFAYHTFLIWNSLFPNRTTPFPPTPLWSIGVPFSDGLNTQSAFQNKRLDRQAWFTCTADNCLTPKGFTYSQIQLPGGQTVDMYNLHADTSVADGVPDNLDQITNYIQQNSAGRAIIVTGDFNVRYSESPVLAQFLADNGLTDVWVQKVYNGNIPANAPVCKDQNSCELLDKVMYRSASDGSVALTAKSYQNEALKFLGDGGDPLSDHSPVMAGFGFVVKNLTPPAP